MMGKFISDFEAPVTKTTKGLIVIDETHHLVSLKTVDMDKEVKRSKSACIQCSQCSMLCPRNLLGHDLNPHKIMRALNYSLHDKNCYRSALICCQCNICELYACPMGLSPKSVNDALKKELISLGIKYQATDKAYEVSPAREFRKVPVKSLLRRLGLKKYDVEAPLRDLVYIPERVIRMLQHMNTFPGLSPFCKHKYLIYPI